MFNDFVNYFNPSPFYNAGFNECIASKNWTTINNSVQLLIYKQTEVTLWFTSKRRSRFRFKSKRRSHFWFRSKRRSHFWFTSKPRSHFWFRSKWRSHFRFTSKRRSHFWFANIWQRKPVRFLEEFHWKLSLAKVEINLIDQTTLVEACWSSTW